MNHECALCGNDYTKAHWAHGNNPEPILPSNRRVCDDCNSFYVIPARLGQLTENQIETLRNRDR